MNLSTSDNCNVNKDRLSSSREDHNIQSLLPNVTKMDHSLSIIVTYASCKNKTQSSVISLGNARPLLDGEHLNTENTGKDNAILSSMDSCKTLSVAKLSPKYRKSKGISKRKQRAANRNSLLFLHTWMGCVVMSIFQLVQAETVDGSDVVTWDLKTKPIVFGETLELVCKIFDENNLCNGRFQQWYGSKQDTLLCQDGKCRNEEKYTFKKNSNCSYSLMIHNLSISDVDISYSCAFGITEMKKGLMMKDYEFLKLPRNNSVSPSLTIDDSIVDVSLKIDDIYPKPNCTIILHDKDIKKKAYISSTVTPGGIFFIYKMHIMHTVTKKDCGSLLIVSCYIGSFPVTNFSKELDNCTDFTSDPWMGNISTLIISMIIVTAVVIICVVIFVLSYFKGVLFYGNRSTDQENQTESVAIVKCIRVVKNNNSDSNIQETDVLCISNKI